MCVCVYVLAALSVSSLGLSLSCRLPYAAAPGHIPMASRRQLTHHVHHRTPFSPLLHRALLSISLNGSSILPTVQAPKSHV